MEKILNYLLLFCTLTLLASAALFVAAEYPSRYWIFVENKEFIDNVAHRESFDPTRGDARYSALILSFHLGERPDTEGPKKTNMYYDFEGRGVAIKTGWAGAKAGLLVVEENGEPRLVGYSGAGDIGFAWLAAADADHNGRLDEGDPVWPSLRVWLDSNINGRVDEAELSTLSKLKISSLDVVGLRENKYLGNGNFLEYAGKFHYGEGQSGRLDEVFLRQHSAALRFARPLEGKLSEALPNIPGSGLARNLREAALLNPELERLAAELLKETDEARRWARLDALMSAWAQTGGLAQTLEERLSDQPYILTDDGLGGPEGPELARRLNVLEAWAGRHFFMLPHELGPVQQIAEGVTLYNPATGELSFSYQPVREDIDRIYNHVTESIYRQLFPGSEAQRPGSAAPADQAVTE